MLRLLSVLAALVVLVPHCAAQEKKGVYSTGLIAQGRLIAADPIDPMMRNPCKRYPMAMTAETVYVIDLISTDFDAYLRLEDRAGKQLAFDDDSGGNRNARIFFVPPTSDTYQVIATCLGSRGNGQYTIRILPANRDASQKIHVEGLAGDFKDVSVLPEPTNLNNVGSGGSGDDMHGYADVRFMLLNHSPTATHTVILTLPKSNSFMSGRSGAYLHALRTTVTLGPSESKSVSLFQPNLPFSYSAANLEVKVDGRTWGESVPANLLQRGDRFARFNFTPTSAGWFTRSVMTSPQLVHELRNNVYKSAVGRPLGVKSSPFSVQRGAYKDKQYEYVDFHRFFEVRGTGSIWSPNWLAYSGHDGVALRSADLRAPQDVKNALWQYVECGGSLLLVGPAEVPASWHKSKTTTAGFAAYYPGLGHCLVTADTDVGKWEPEQWQAIVNMWERSAQPFQNVQTADDANRRLPIADDIRIPVRGLFLAMLAFAVLIGPINVFVLRRMRRRVWLLWTVPVFSLATCALVAGIMVSSEDWDGQVRMEGITVLDETAGTAASAGWLGLLTPRTPPDGLHFSKHTELTPHVTAKPGKNPPGSPRVLDWSEDQNLRSGWVTARVPAHFLVRAHAPSTRFLRVKKADDGTSTMVNGLGANITEAWVADEAGKIWHAAAVPSEGEGALTRTDLTAAGTGTQLRAVYSQDWLGVLDSLTAQPAQFLRPGCYLALLDDAPFFEPGLKGAKSRRSRQAVLGTVTRQGVLKE